MKEKSRFQKELERHASKQIIFSILIGCFFFCVAMVGITMLDQKLKQEKHLDAIEATFRTIQDSSEEFLMSEENTEIFFACMEEGAGGNSLKYQVSKYNLEALVGIRLIVTDREGQVRFSSFSGEEMNLHRLWNICFYVSLLWSSTSV